MHVAYKILKVLLMNLTKNRMLILKILFTHPDREFYIQELGRALDKKPGVFQRDLNSLEKEGILESSYKANARYFKVNKKHPLYNELKSIVAKTVGVEATLKKVLSSVSGIKLAFIYGSFAGGKEVVFSDIDLFIIGMPDENQLLKKIGKVEDELQREINYTYFPPVELEEKLAKRDQFILNVMKGPKVMLVGKESDLSRLTR